MPQTLSLHRFRAAHAPLLALTGPAELALRGVTAAQAREGAPRTFDEALAGLARRYEAAGPAWTLFAQGRPVACGGAVRFWPGVGECWLWLARDAAHNPVALARHARHAMLLLRQRHGFRRLQAHVRVDNPAAARFALFLGLRLEGECPGYGPDHATHQLYGRFWQWKA